MYFLFRMINHAPSDDTLWNMLNDHAVHFAIDNQAMQIMKTTRFNSTARAKALRVSQTYSDYTNNLDAVIPTIEVLSQPLDWPEEKDDKEIWHRAIQKQKLPCLHVAPDKGAMRYRAAAASEAWIDPMNPRALRHAIYIKNQNDVMSPANRDYFSFKGVTERPPKFAVIDGYFEGICPRDTDYGAMRRGLKRIVDPACVIDHKHDPASIGKILFDHPFSTIVTEPGQIAHVLSVYNKPQL